MIKLNNTQLTNKQLLRYELNKVVLTVLKFTWDIKIINTNTYAKLVKKLMGYK